MASQTQIAGAGADDASVGTIAWANPGNITADDGTNAVAAGMNNSEISHYLVSSSHGFSIPAGATIDGIVVEVDRHQGATQSMADHRLRIVKGGTIGATDRADTGTIWPTTPTTVSYGSSSDLWGETWTVSDINASNFGVALASIQPSGSPVQARVDFIRITVHYTEASGTTFERSASLAATGAIAAAGTFWTVFERAVTLAASGAAASVPQRDLLRQTAISATGAIASVPQRDLHRQSALSAAAAVTASGVRIVERSATLTATAAISSAPQRDLLRQTAVSAAGSIETAGEIDGQIPEHERSAAIAAAGAVTAAGARVVSRSAAVSANGTVSATAQRELLRAVQLAAGTGVQAAGTREVSRTAALSAAGNVSATGTFWSTLERSASLTTTATVEASGSIVLFEPDTNPTTLAYTEPGAVSYREPAAIVHRETGDTFAHRE